MSLSVTSTRILSQTQTPMLGTPAIGTITITTSITGTIPSTTVIPTATSSVTTTSTIPSTSTSTSTSTTAQVSTTTVTITTTTSPSPVTSTSTSTTSPSSSSPDPIDNTTTTTLTSTSTSTTSTTTTTRVPSPTQCPDMLCPPILQSPSSKPLECIDLARAPPFRALASTSAHLFLPTDLSPWTLARFPPANPTSDTLIRASQAVRSPQDLQVLLNLIVSNWPAYNLHLTGGCSPLPSHRYSLTFLVLDVASFFASHPCNTALGAAQLPSIHLCAQARDDRLTALRADLASSSSSSNTTCASSSPALAALQNLPTPLISTDPTTCRSPDALGLDSRVLCGYATSAIALANACDATRGAAGPLPADTPTSHTSHWTASLITGVAFACLVLALLAVATARLAVRKLNHWRHDRAVFGASGGSRDQYNHVARDTPSVVLVKPKLPNVSSSPGLFNPALPLPLAPPPPRPPRPSSDVGVVYQVIAVRPSSTSSSSLSSSTSTVSSCTSLQGVAVPMPTMSPATPPVATTPPNAWSAPGSWRGPPPLTAAPVLVQTPVPSTTPSPVVHAPKPRTSATKPRSPTVGVRASATPPVLHKVSSVPAIGSPLRQESTDLLLVDADDTIMSDDDNTAHGRPALHGVLRRIR